MIRAERMRAAVLAIAWGVVGCGAGAPHEGAGGDAREHAPDTHAHEPAPGLVELDEARRTAGGIEVAAAGPATIHEHVVLGGRIAANEDALAHLRPRYPGVVLSIHKRVGDAVAPGDLLAVLESNESLRSYEVRARLAGTVIGKEIAPGEFVSNEQEIFLIADLSTVWVDLDVYRPDFGRLRIGQRVQVDAGDGTPPVASTISYLSPVGAPNTQTLLARAVLPNPDRTWRPGLFVTAEVEGGSEDVAVAVAAGAIQRLGDRDVVYLEREGGFVAQPVELGRRDAERVEVLVGLVAGQRYVASGSFIVKAEAGKAGVGHEH